LILKCFTKHDANGPKSWHKLLLIGFETQREQLYEFDSNFLS
jgi:hypothetical protein